MGEASVLRPEELRVVEGDGECAERQRKDSRLRLDLLAVFRLEGIREATVVEVAGCPQAGVNRVGRSTFPLWEKKGIRVDGLG
jgi:hypothetical protein